MADPQREVLEALKSELWFLEMRGYEPSVRDAHKEVPIFRDSPSCLNYALPVKEHSCATCWLMDFVPAEKWGEEIPCQHIPLNSGGGTIAAMGERGESLAAQETVREWLRRKIKEMETAWL
jgi:hypothetical protein